MKRNFAVGLLVTGICGSGYAQIAPIQGDSAPGRQLSNGNAAPANVRGDFLKLIDRPKVPLAPEIKETARANGLVEYRFTYGADAADRVPGMLVESADGTGRRPVVIALHGTGGSKAGELPLLRRLAQRGFIGVAIDGRYHGERATPTTGHPNDYDKAILKAWESPEPHEHPFFFDSVWDVMRLVDYLETREDVDAQRVGLYGVSKGGIETYLTAAVDTRIAVAVPCISVESFRWAMENDSWESRIGTIQTAFDAAAKEAGVAKPDGTFVSTFYDHVAPAIAGEFDGPSMVPLIAPRPLMTVNGEIDPRTPMPGLKLCIDATKAAYKAVGAEDHLEVRIQPNTAHKVNPDSEQAAIEWFVRWLKPEAGEQGAIVVKRNLAADRRRYLDGRPSSLPPTRLPFPFHPRCR